MHSVQIDANLHLLANDDLIYTNHSFTPNCQMKVYTNPPKLQLVAIKEIKPEEELSFDYNTTEWELSCPFEDISTHKKVTGAKYLDASEIKTKWQYFPDWLKEKLQSERPQVLPTKAMNKLKK